MKTKILIGLLIIGILLLGGCGEKPITGVEWFQTGNTQDITLPYPELSQNLEDNRMGGMWVADIYSEGDVDWFVNDVGNSLGLKWIRLSFDWFDWDEIAENGEYSKQSIGPYQEEAITALAENGVNIIYTLLYWDETIDTDSWEGEEDYSRFTTEEEIQRYLDHVRFIVSSLKDRVDYYEILNEQNHCEGTQQKVQLEDYVNLVKRVVPVIREEHPGAKIIAGATSDTRQTPPREYLFGFLESDAMPLIDAISFHPMYGTSPQYHPEYYENYPTLMQEIKDTASAHGFEGEYIADEMNWRTSRNPHPDESWTYSERVAAKYFARAIMMHLGMDFITGLSGLETEGELPFMKAVKNLCTVMAGATPVDMDVEIESDATNIKHYSFTLSNGDKLVALWTDGIAVDEDPGVKTNVTIKGVTASEVTGIDVLEGYEQSLTISSEGANLIIKGLLVRDYPLIFRITKQ